MHYPLLLIKVLLGIYCGFCDGNTEIDVKEWNYSNNDVELEGYYATPEGEGDFAAVVIIPDWDGVNEYEKIRATMVAKEMGYVGFAADIYGVDYHQVDDFDKRVELATKYRSDPDLFIGRIEAAVKEVSMMNNVNSEEISLMGYCFGGTGALLYSLSDKADDVKAVISVHGGLMPFSTENRTQGNETQPPRVLVLSGGEDDTSTGISELEDTLDNASDPWEVTRYSGIEHAFSVFDDERYDPWADYRSWESSTSFLHEVYGEDELQSNEPDDFDVTGIHYEGLTENGDAIKLTGYVSYPDDDTYVYPLPVVVILPDWDGVNTYEKKRATMLADQGYIGFAADIFGSDLQEDLDMATRIELATKYNSNITLYVQRIQRAIDQAKELDGVDGNQIALIGYCFGGTGAVQYSFSGAKDAKVAVSFHGSFFQERAPEVTQDIYPYTLIMSGGSDPQHGNQTLLEDSLNSGNAQWEITGYSGVGHGFTNWNSASYDLNADVRSWQSMMDSFRELLVTPKMSSAHRVMHFSTFLTIMLCTFVFF